MKLDDNKYYRMPFIMGPAFDRDNIPQILYPKTESLVLQYKSDPEAIASLLPECYLPTKEPIVTVIFGYNSGLEFMAGGEYRIATVQVSARFKGEKDNVEGDYILVMFENETAPIIGGREDLGVPKIYADISPIKMLSEGHLRCEASLWGHLLFGIDLEPLKEQSKIVIQVASKRINERPWLCYKYIPSLDGPPDANYPTMSKNDVKIEQLWLGKSGKIFFSSPDYEDVAYTKHVVDNLKTLKFNEVVQTAHICGSSVLRYDLSRRLK
jgi:acetoacetate decarboxylase